MSTRKPKRSHLAVQNKPKFVTKEIDYSKFTWVKIDSKTHKLVKK